MTAQQRIGGDLVLESIQALGGNHVVGLPGQHALGLFDALRRSDLNYLGSRIENNAGFMADGLARTTGTVAPLFLSTGPGALTSLAALQEAAASSIPVLAISAQIPVHGVGGGRHGYLHELPDQSASFRGIVKHVFTVRQLSQIIPAITEAWQLAIDAPSGPVLVEIPQDILLTQIGDEHPEPQRIALTPRAPELHSLQLEQAARLLSQAKNPAILAGGGVAAAGAQRELITLAERTGAVVATTFGGKSGFPWDHSLSLQSWGEDYFTTEILNEADVFVAIGTGMGELSSNYFTLVPTGQVIHIEADLGKVTSNHAGLGIHADARDALQGILHELGSFQVPETQLHRGAETASSLRKRVAERLASQPLEKELTLMRELRKAVPADTHTFWDMTILGYWAWSAWSPADGIFASAQGAGGLGYGLPAAIGSAFVAQTDGGSSVLAISGDGGSLYSIAELATLAQHSLDVTWLIVDDGGYGILREYMEAEFGAATATELARPDFVALAKSFGVNARRASIEDVPQAVADALATGGPQVIVLEEKLELFAPTHLSPPRVG